MESLRKRLAQRLVEDGQQSSAFIKDMDVEDGDVEEDDVVEVVGKQTKRTRSVRIPYPVHGTHLKAFFAFMTEDNCTQDTHVKGISTCKTKKRASKVPTLAVLKRFAKMLSYHPGWQNIRASQKKELLDLLRTSQSEIRTGIQAVLKSKKRANTRFRGRLSQIMGTKSRRKRIICGKRKQRLDTETSEVEKRLWRSFQSCIHFIPSGCGTVVEVGPPGGAASSAAASSILPSSPTPYGASEETAHVRFIITCAHCIEVGEEEEMDFKTRDAKRLGRLKFVLFPDGALGLTECVYSNTYSDTAAMRLLLREPFHTTFMDTVVEEEKEHGSGTTEKSGGGPSRAPRTRTVLEGADALKGLRCATIASKAPKRGDPILIVHNPWQYDLEAEGPARRMKNFFPFRTDIGKVDGFRKTDRRDATNLGALKHSAWTYWGSSGAPLFDRRTGHVIGMHNSWDDRCGQRHGCTWESISTMLRDVRMGLCGGLEIEKENQSNNEDQALEEHKTTTNGKAKGKAKCRGEAGGGGRRKRRKTRTAT